MSGMFSKLFWRDTTERALSTGAQAMLAAIGADMFNVLEADWAGIAAVGAGGVVLSVLKAVASVGRTGSASAVRPPF